MVAEPGEPGEAGESAGTGEATETAEHAEAHADADEPAEAGRQHICDTGAAIESDLLILLRTAKALDANKKPEKGKS